MRIDEPLHHLIGVLLDASVCLPVIMRGYNAIAHCSKPFTLIAGSRRRGSRLSRALAADQPAPFSTLSCLERPP